MFFKEGNIVLYNSDCLEVLRTFEDNSIDSLVTDPPYGISFMGKHWDYQIPSVEIWQECLRVLKPGSHALVACGTRTQHRMAVNLEDAGFEIRDVVAWIYGSGFPKSLNIGKAIQELEGIPLKDTGIVSPISRPNVKEDLYQSGKVGKNFTIKNVTTENAKQWEGWGTALKPSCELWTLCRKPLGEKTVAQNVLKYGTGGINIDGCRIEADWENSAGYRPNYKNHSHIKGVYGGNSYLDSKTEYKEDRYTKGRFPANLIHDGSEEVVELFPESNGSGNARILKRSVKPNQDGWGMNKNDPDEVELLNAGTGSSSRFFYCAKASKRERNEGLDNYLIVKYNTDKKDLLCEESTVAVQLLKKVISGSDQMSLNIGECGKSIMAMCHKAYLSTILTEINKTIELKILNSLILLLTKEYIQDVNLETENGGSRVENVEYLKKWILTITKEKTELALGASHVALKMLFLIKEKENWKDASNFHSTVKPINLMKYLCRLITPPNGIVLDPFMGSGSTGCACNIEGFKFIGIEKEKDYCEISKRRITFYSKKEHQTELEL